MKKQARFKGILSLVLVVVFVAAGGVIVGKATADDRNRTSKSTNVNLDDQGAARGQEEALVASTSSDFTPTTAGKVESAATDSRPEVLIGASTAGRLVVIDSTTGNTVKVLARYDNPKTCNALGTVSLSLDSKTVYFQRNFEATSEPFPEGSVNTYCRSEVHKISIDGGKVEKVADGFTPRLSWDGRKLSYLVPVGIEKEGWAYSSNLVVLDLDSGSSRVVAKDIGCDCGPTAFATWSKDNKHIAVQGVNCGCGGMSFNELKIIDIAGPDVTTVKAPKAIDEHAGWGDPTFLPDGNMFLFEIGRDDFDKGFKSAPRMLIVNPVDGKIVKVITTGFVDRYYEGTNVDQSGKHLLYLSSGNLMVSDDWERPTQLATGLLSADW